jgi:hypothetical protein
MATKELVISGLPALTINLLLHVLILDNDNESQLSIKLIASHFWEVRCEKYVEMFCL